jgi:uncharacterized repeat protein (TIGR03803 family)
MKTTLKQLSGRIKSVLTMKSRVKNPLLLLLIASLGLMLAGRATAQTFTTLHSFTALVSGTNSDGATPYYAGLILSGNTLYGTTALGGTNGNGTVFAVNPNPNGAVTALHTFTATFGSNYTNSDGASPNAGLILSGNTLYGIGSFGGTNGNGTVFAVNTNGTSFTTLHTFSATSGSNSTNSDGATSLSALIISSNTLYGTSSAGGTNGNGTVFAVNTNGTGFTTLHTFSAAPTNLLGFYTNSDGTGPTTIVLSGNILYGTAYAGGTNGNGTVFAVNTNGTGFTALHTFTATYGLNSTNSDGANPYTGLILSGNTLFGTASGGGTNGNGTVFAVNTNGTGFTTLHSFTATSGSNSTNSDGASPQAGLVLSGNILYGTAFNGGTNGFGTVFAVNTNGTGFTTLHTFMATSGSNSTNSDGANPNAGPILSGNTLYGTASAGGLGGNGTVFGLSFPPPQLNITLSGTNVNVMWPSGVAGFSYSGYTLQSTTNLAPPAASSVISATPVVVNGQNAVTNPVSGTQQFYRLIQ